MAPPYLPPLCGAYPTSKHTIPLLTAGLPRSPHKCASLAVTKSDNIFPKTFIHQMRPVFFLFRHFSLSYKLSTKCARAFAPAKSRTLTPFTALQKSIHQMRPRAHLPPPAGLSSYTPIFICTPFFLHTPLFFSSNEMHSKPFIHQAQLACACPC